MTNLFQFLQENWRAPVEIVILTVAIYYIFSFFRGTRGWAVFTGFFVVLLSVAILVNFFDLKILQWLLGAFSTVFVVAVLVIFQPEVRRMFAELGNLPLFYSSRE